MAKKEKFIDNSIIRNEKIEDIFSFSFGRYAKYIIQDRALPDIRDGLKPVQRRIIYAMHNLQMLHDKPHKKSVRTVGEVIGKYHPHGDTSIYDAMVVMSQQWKKNIPMVDMHGNNGSIDNDAWAAMRYTESRMSLYSELLIKNIEKNTVLFIENFDGSEIEPTVLPTLLPNLLINGANGIAAGYATNIPPFNILELIECLIKKLDNPDLNLQSILKILPGPDFPTGGIILNKEGIIEAYQTGKGKINIRGVIELVNKKQAYITQIPYEVNKAILIDEINECAEKYETLNISECHDETDDNGISICINLKNSDNFQFLKNFLYKHTQLQIAYNFNMIAIKDRKPCLIDIITYFDTFLKYCDEIVEKYTKFDLEKVSKRKEIVSGLINAISILDKIILTIRKSNDKASAISELINKFNFTKNQAEAIVNLRLYRLSNTDILQLKNELEELDKLIIEYEKILNDKDYRNLHIKNVFKEYKKIFKDYKRKSTFSDEESNINIDISETIEDKEISFVATRDGYLKNVSKRSFENNEFKEIGIKSGDIPIVHFISNQRNKVVLITNKGNFITIPVHKIEQTKWKEHGIHLNSISAIEGNEKIIFACEINNENQKNTIVLATKNGMIKQVMLEDLNTKIIKTSKVINLIDDSLIGAVLNDTNDENILIGFSTISGKTLMYPLSQIPCVGKNASGVKNGSFIEEIGSLFIDYPNKKYLVMVCNEGVKKIGKNEIFVGKRTSVPKPLINITKSNIINLFFSIEANNNDEIIFLHEDNKISYNKVSEIEKSSSKEKIDKLFNKKILFCSLMSNFEVLKDEKDEQKKVSIFDN